MHLRFIVATVAATLVFAPNALAGPCGLPDTKPLWVDYAESSVDFRDEVFRRPGLVLASSGTSTPQSLRDGGAHTVYWQMKLMRFVGTPSEPADAGTVAVEAAELLDRAAVSSGCATPLIALEEMWGANLPTPWSPSNSAYRTNVLELARQLSARGARPFLFVHGNLELGGAAGAWWQQLSASADIVYESYFDAPRTYALGPVLASRALRVAMRRPVSRLAALGIDPARLGLILGFHSKPGTSGREGLQPLGAWLQFVKLNALAARQVAGELGLGSIWSWGWGTFDAAGADPDKPLAACTYLWTRDQSLCDAPARAAFDTSLTDGQLILPEGVQCAFPAGMVPEAAVARLAPFAGSRRAAVTALVARRALRGARVRPGDITRAEWSLVSAKYAGSYARYRRALALRGLTRADAVAILTVRLRARRLGARAAGARLAAAADSALCLRDELPGRVFVDLAKKL
ncbi:MAG: hypothetical protein ACJ75P_03660 [Gaiellaceae bacterium]